MQQKEGVLITGGTGLVGSHLVAMLKERGYNVHILSRSKSNDPVVFQWDVGKGSIERDAFEGMHHIVHLAGAGLADKRWTKKRKREIIDSRVKSANLLYESVQKWNLDIRSFISPSGIDYYDDFGDQRVTEEMASGDDFLSIVCEQWEQAALQFQTLNVRSVQLRMGLVLAAEEGILKEMYRPLQFGLAPYFGDGSQLFSWVHIKDVCRAYIYMLEQPDLSGPFNLVARNPVSNKTFIRLLKKVSGKPALTFGIPSIALKIALGELATALLGGANISDEKIRSHGFDPEFETLENALQDLLLKN